MVAWLLLFVALEVSNLYLQGLARDSTTKAVDNVHGSFAGSIDSLTQQIMQSPTRCLSEEASKMLCIGLLARIRNFAQHRLVSTDGNRLRVTLTVPIAENAPGDPKITALRTWCYDEPYQDRRWTRLRLDLQGAPKAYATGTIQVIDDLLTLAERADEHERPYRSIASLPVKAGGPSGKTLAVVNIDSTLPSFFNVERVKHLLPIISPAINVIALVILTRDEAAYAFNS
jgi:GAF domain-containing protein